MQVFKFGGSILKDAGSIKKLGELLKSYEQEDLAIVVSAMGKTTNALEGVLDSYLSSDGLATEKFAAVKAYHQTVAADLFAEDDAIWVDLSDLLVEVEWILEDDVHDERPYLYDQIVCLGELLSSCIVAAYLNAEGLPVKWHDARGLLITDDHFTQAAVDLAASARRVADARAESEWLLTQGFIGGTIDNNSTTLGREGSDYSAALLTYFLDADALTLWKDVDGIYTGDPKLADPVERLEQLSYDEALAIIDAGAKVIHRKALHLLKEQKIPLRVRPFADWGDEGSLIG